MNLLKGDNNLLKKKNEKISNENKSIFVNGDEEIHESLVKMLAVFLHVFCFTLLIQQNYQE